MFCAWTSPLIPTKSLESCNSGVPRTVPLHQDRGTDLLPFEFANQSLSARCFKTRLSLKPAKRDPIPDHACVANACPSFDPVAPTDPTIPQKGGVTARRLNLANAERMRSNRQNRSRVQHGFQTIECGKTRQCRPRGGRRGLERLGNDFSHRLRCLIANVAVSPGFGPSHVSPSAPLNIEKTHAGAPLPYASTIRLRIAYRTSAADELRLSLRMAAAR